MSDLFTEIKTPNGKTIEQPLGLFINNEWVATEETFETINPSTEEKICSVYRASEKHVDLAVEAANQAFKSSEWSDLSGAQRGDILYKMYEIIKRDAETLASIETLDNGKSFHYECLPGDLSETADVFKYYAGWADKQTGQLIGSSVFGKNKLCYVEPVPLGAVGCIVPWNFPLCMMAWKIAPALATGCTLVVKSSEITPLSALHFGKIALEAGLPKGVLNILSGYGSDVGSAMVSHTGLKKIAFTGSTFTGQKIMQGAGASNLKKVTLECGGKSPYIVFDDADLELALEWAYFGIWYNKGEVCTSTSRFFIHENIYDKFVESFKKQTEEKVILGCPFDEKTTFGPVVSNLQYDKIKKYVELGKKEGAKLISGEFVDGPGYFCKPFIFTDCTDDMTIMKEEIFGPVVAISKFKTVEEVITRANDTTYGLAAALFSNNITKAHNVASRLEAGMVWINSNGDSDIHVPFGGSKMSGIGRELGSYALDLFTENKAIHVNMTVPFK